MCLRLVTTGIFKTVDHKFALSGHSFLPCDRDFGLIEKRRRVICPMVLSDVADLIKSARPSREFNVVHVTSADWYDFHTLAASLKTEQIQLKGASWLRYSIKQPNAVLVRKSLNNLEPWKPVKLLRPRVTVRAFRTAELRPKPARSLISEAKKKDLQKMIPYLPDQHRKFYVDLCSCACATATCTSYLQRVNSAKG